MAKKDRDQDPAKALPEALNLPVQTLKRLVAKPPKPVSIEAMNAAIAAQASKTKIALEREC